MSQGLLYPDAYANLTSPLYQKKGEAIVAPTLVAPVSITSSTGSTTSVINMEGNPASGYFGAVSLTTGAGGAGVPQQLALTADPTASGVDVWIGGNGAGAVNRLFIDGPAPTGLSQVNDPVYNPAVYFKSLPETAIPGLIPLVGPAGKVSNILTIPVANGNAGSVSVPSTYKLFQLNLDFAFEMVTTGGADTYKIYLSDTIDGGYDASKNLSFARFGGTGTYLEDLQNETLSLYLSGGNATNLYLNFQNETAVEGGDVTQIVVNYLLTAQPVKAIALV